MSEPGLKLACSIAEAAKAMGVSKATVWRRIKEGEIETFRWCGRTLIRADVLQALVDRLSGRVAA